MLIARPILFVFTIAAALAGCGEAPEAPAAKAAPVVKAIFISTNDCIPAKKIPQADCITAIDLALATHQQKATTYSSLQQCTKVEGEDRCDKTVSGYGPRIQAFYVTLTTPPTAEPLYPLTQKDTIGFRSPTQKIVNAQDDTLIVSASALSLAHDNARLP